MRYPAGESHISLNGFFDDGETILMDKCRNFEDIGNILTGAEILKRAGYKDITWFIPYFPFGRHDRRRDNRDGFELKIALEMVSHLDVVTLDPHSDVLGQLPHIPQKSFVNKLFSFSDKYIIIPDQGAVKKAHTWLKKDQWVAYGHKLRDPVTGNLSGFRIEVEDLEHFKGKPCIIVDDICDGGGTFIGLAKELKKLGAGSLTLAVTHGLFTKGLDELKLYFDEIFTTGYKEHDKNNKVGPYIITYRDIYYGAETI